MKLKALLFFTVVLLVSCAKDKRLYPNTSAITKQQLALERVDSTLFSADNLDLKNLSKLYFAKRKDSSRAYKFYIEDIMHVSAFGNPMGVNLLHRFLRDTSFRSLQHKIDSVFGNFTKQQEELNTAFSRAKYLLPNLELPVLATYNTGFNVAIFPDSAFLGIGLDWFIGADNEMVQGLSAEKFPLYKRQKMEPKFLVPNAVKGYLLVNMFEADYTKDLLSLMLYYGKIQLVMQALLPNVDEATLLEYTPEQLAWCKQNETNIWKELLKENILFSSSDKEKSRWTNDGPFTSGLPQESSARLGIYMGYQMVKAYFDDNKDISLEQLMQEKDFKTILRAYKPF